MAATGYISDPRAVTSVEGRTGAVDITLDDVGGTAAIDDAVDAALGTQITDAIATHAAAVDPHGDRAYADGQVTTLSAATTTALSGKASTVHTHAASDVTSGTFGIARIPTGSTSSTVATGDHNHSGTYAPVSHQHSGADITSGTVPIAQLPTGTSGSTVALGNHVHAAGDTTSGTFAIARIPTGTSSTTAALGDHLHAGTYANASHTHSGADITSGTVPIAQLPTGTSGSTVAVGNHTHGVATGGTGLTTVTTNSYLKGNGTGALVERTYAQVKTDIGLDAGAWTAPSSFGSANITNTGTPYYDVGSRTEPNSRVALRGRVSASTNYTADATIMTLDSSAWPARTVIFQGRSIGAGAAAGFFTITTSGVVSFSTAITVGAGSGWVFDGLGYYAGAN